MQTQIHRRQLIILRDIRKKIEQNCHSTSTSFKLQFLKHSHTHSQYTHTGRRCNFQQTLKFINIIVGKDSTYQGRIQRSGHSGLSPPL